MPTMKNGIIKRGSTWAYVLRVPDPATGKTKPTWYGGFRTATDAKAARDKARTRILDGQHIESPRMSLADFLTERWLPAIEVTGKRPTTLRSYRLVVERRIIPRIGGLKLQAVSGDVLNTLYATLLREGRERGEQSKGLAPATVRKVHGVLHKAFADAVRWGILVRNPADAADPPKQGGAGDAVHEIWTAAELAKFLEATKGDRLGPLWHLLANTGMRRGEALGLRWEDLDLKAGRAAIRQTLVMVGYEVTPSQPKTSRGRRSIALDRRTVAVLRSWRATQAKERLAWGPAWTDTGLVFTREDGTLIHPMAISRSFGVRIKKIDVKKVRLHDLRHTHATLGLAAGVHPKKMSERLGHATVAFTLDTYTAAIPELDHDVAEVIAGLLG